MKKVGIAIVQIAIAGIAIFVAIQICHGGKQDDIDVSQVAVEEVEETPESSETDESLTDSTVKSELENKENISENNDLHANGGGAGEISLEQTEDGSFKDPAIDHQDENNITSEPADNTTSPRCDQTAEEMGDIGSWDEIEQGADLPTEEEMQWAMDLIEQNGAVLH